MGPKMSASPSRPPPVVAAPLQLNWSLECRVDGGPARYVTANRPITAALEPGLVKDSMWTGLRNGDARFNRLGVQFRICIELWQPGGIWLEDTEMFWAVIGGKQNWCRKDQ